MSKKSLRRIDRRLRKIERRLTRLEQGGEWSLVGFEAPLSPWVGDAEVDTEMPQFRAEEGGGISAIG